MPYSSRSASLQNITLQTLQYPRAWCKGLWKVKKLLSIILKSMTNKIIALNLPGYLLSNLLLGKDLSSSCPLVGWDRYTLRSICITDNLENCNTSCKRIHGVSNYPPAFPATNF
jgi:hypothetical protein